MPRIFHVWANQILPSSLRIVDELGFTKSYVRFIIMIAEGFRLKWRWLFLAYQILATQLGLLPTQRGNFNFANQVLHFPYPKEKCLQAPENDPRQDKCFFTCSQIDREVVSVGVACMAASDLQYLRQADWNLKSTSLFSYICS